MYKWIAGYIDRWVGGALSNAPFRETNYLGPQFGLKIRRSGEDSYTQTRHCYYARTETHKAFRLGFVFFFNFKRGGGGGGG